MADISKPIYGTVWASTGEKLAPIEAKMQSGWVQEMMPYQYENFLQNRQDIALTYLFQKGVSEWSSEQEYIANKSIVSYLSNLYVSTATNTNVVPTDTASWRRLTVTFDTNGTIPIAAGGTGANTAAGARTNLGLGSIATATAPTSNGVVVRTAADTLISRSITGTANNIVVTNGDGVAGNISINAGSNVALLNTDSSWTSTGSIRLPSGSTSQQGASTPGRVRFNLEADEFHGAYSDGWKVLARPASAEQTPITDVGNFYTSSNVEGALQEVGLKASFVKDAILSYPNYAAASAAAATLPDGQTVVAPNSDGRTSWFGVLNGALVFKDFLPDVVRFLSYADLAGYSGEHFVADITSAGISGRFYRRGAAEANGGTVIKDAMNRSWERCFTGPVDVGWFGAVPDFTSGTGTDNSGAIQAALGASNDVMIGPGSFGLAKPIYIDPGKRLIGAGRAITSITKFTATPGVGSNVMRGGTITDSYVKNAVIICRHPDNDFAYNSIIEGMAVRSHGYTVEYGIYAPRMATWSIRDVEVFQCRYGLVTNDAWMTELRNVVCNSNTLQGLDGYTYGWAEGSRGFWWADDGSGNATGTTLTALNCWARDCHIGWDIQGLKYSALVGCGADNISACAYKFYLTNITLSGCGMERVQVGAGLNALTFDLSSVDLSGFKSYDVRGNADAATSAWMRADGSTVSFTGCEISDFVGPGLSHNAILQNGAKITLNGARFPANGDSFISYSGGSQVLNLSNTPPTIITATGVRHIGGRVNDNLRQEKSAKSIPTGGTSICNFSSSGGGVDTVSAKVTVHWYDTTYPAGVGISEIFVVCYQDGGTNYRQNIQVGTNMGAGNGFATAPSYTLTRSGAVWSLIMTPAHGDCVASVISAEVGVSNGFTSVIP